MIRPIPGMSRREAAKAERRRRIVGAVRALVKETGEAGLSMRAIADRAGVSITTPYNLFGSKRAIVIAVLEDVREFNERFSRLARAGAIDRIFEAVALSLGYFAEDPDFYRTLWAEALRVESRDLRGELSSPQRYAFWWALLTEARREGALLPAIELDPLLRSLDAMFVAAMLAWVLGAIEVEELIPSVGYGYALVLRGAATGAYQAPIEARLLAYQEALRRHRAGITESDATASPGSPG